MITKRQLKQLYSREARGDPYTNQALKYAARAIYPKVVDECTYTQRGERHWMGASGTTMKAIQSAFQKFVEEYESGPVRFTTFDAVIWAVHHNGVLADKFISDCRTEDEAINFLNELSGIRRCP